MQSLKHISKFKNLVSLPYTKTLIDNTRVVVQQMDMSEFEDVYAIYASCGAEEDGYSKYEMRRESLFERFSKTDVLTMRNEANNEVMTVIPVFDSPACRSTKAFLSTSFAVVNRKYRGQGVAVEMYTVAEKYSIDKGYMGYSARAYITGRNILPARRTGALVVAYIPFCSHLDTLGYVDDVLVFKDYNIDKMFPDYFKGIIDERSGMPNVIDPSKPIPDFALPKREIEPKMIQTPDGSVQLRGIKQHEEILHIESIFKNAARNSEGIGLDEFTDEGYFNRKFFREADLMLAENTQGDIVGASMFGPSALSRMATPVIGHCYLAVDPSNRRQGIGKALIKYTMDLLKREGHKGIFSDAYVNNNQMLKLMGSLKYTILGSMPKCGLIAENGLTDSLLLYRHL